LRRGDVFGFRRGSALVARSRGATAARAPGSHGAVVASGDFDSGRRLGRRVATRFHHQSRAVDAATGGIAPGTTPDKLFPHRAGLRGLYLGGQTTFPGYGVPTAMLSGIQAAEAAVHDMRRNA
jgi:hypothetical protein